MEKSTDIKGKKRNKKFWFLLSGAALLLALAAFFVARSFWQKQETTKEVTATVSRGSIVRTIEGSGVISAKDQYTISALVTGEVLSDTFSEGDMVEKDSLLYVIDSTKMDSTLQKADSTLESAKLSYEESLETLDNLTVKAPISGTLSSLSVREGDEISSGRQVAEIIAADRMRLTLPFLVADAAAISPGDAATVVPESAPSLSLSGTVESVSGGSMPNALGVAVTQVEILVDNPGGILDGSRATATVGDYACNAAGTFSYEATKTVVAKTGGTVTGLSVKQGDRVEAGSVLFTLESAATSRSIERSRISYQDAVRSRDNTYDQLEDYRITAPISGKVIQKNVKSGDKLESGSGGNASSMAIIADLSVLTFEMSVDELDIANVKEGQRVLVTADAVEGQSFTGHVENVSIVGTAQNGVTSYPVKITLDGAENSALIPGMNVSATIVIEEKTDILLIPAAAISRGNMVTVKGEAPKTEPAPEKEKAKNKPAEGESDAARVEDKAAAQRKQTEAPAGYHYVRIETGITDGTYIEVVSGLAEGDIILLPASAGDKNAAISFTPNAQSMPMGMGMSMPGGMGGMGGMGGGMPGGNRGGMGR